MHVPATRPVPGKERRDEPGIGRQPCELLGELSMQVGDEPRRGAPAFRILLEPSRAGLLLQGEERDGLPGVTDARRRPEHHRDLVRLRQLEGQPDHFLGLARAGRIQDRDLGEHGEEPAVLLGLRAVGARVIGRDEQQPTLDAQIGRPHEGVRGHIQPHLLHGNRGALAGVAGGEGDLVGDLLVHRPLDVHAVRGLSRIRRHGFQDLRGRGPGVRGGDGAPALHDPAPDGLVSHQHAMAHGRTAFPSRPCGLTKSTRRSTRKAMLSFQALLT